MNISHFWQETLRMRWMIVISFAVVFGRWMGYLPNSSPLTLVAYKLSLPCVAFIVAHVAWSQAFAYVDFEDLVAQRKTLELIAMSFLRGMIYASFILGVTLGL